MAQVEDLERDQAPEGPVVQMDDPVAPEGQGLEVPEGGEGPLVHAGYLVLGQVEDLEGLLAEAEAFEGDEGEVVVAEVQVGYVDVGRFRLSGYVEKVGGKLDMQRP